MLSMFDGCLLTSLTFIPLLGALVILCIPSSQTKAIKWAAVFFTLIPLLLAYRLYTLFDPSTTQMQFVEGPHPWISSFNINYFMGIDGISVTMVLLTALLSFICIFASWGINKGVKGYFALFLILDTGMMGVFCALDFFLFYVFWEVMLLPMYFLIGLWGGPRREYAAIKFFLYTLFGSVFMLLAMLWMYFNSEPNTFNMLELATMYPKWTLWSRIVIWVGLFVGFAIKVPIFPFHTWLPDAHVEAPTAISVILAGVLLKMGTYGILRFNFGMLPEATAYFGKFLMIIGVVNILYGAFCAMAQTDLKKLVAYSSVSHMGFVLIGMASFTPEGINGAVLQMFNHGTITAMLFLLVGVLYDRAHHRNIEGFGGMLTQMPVYGSMTALAFFAALGLPGLSGFISEVLCFIGAFQRDKILTAMAVTSVVITAAYMLWTYQRVFLGKFNEKYKEFSDMLVVDRSYWFLGREFFTLFPLAIIVVVLGVYPFPVLNLIEASLIQLNSIVLPFI